MTTADEADQRKRVERARETGLFRYSLVQELLEPGLSQAERGWRARELAGRAHEGPGGRRATVSYSTLTRWRRLYEAGRVRRAGASPAAAGAADPGGGAGAGGGAEAGEAGADRGAGPADPAGQTAGWAPSDRTLQRLFERLELNRPAPGRRRSSGPSAGSSARGRTRCGSGDTLHGPVIGGKKSYLFAFIDDHSRAVMGARWSHHDDVVRMAAAFRPALQARGVPQAAYLDNGSPFVDAWLLRGCAVLGIKLVHSRPGKPEGRGKIERFFRTVRDQFLVEVGDGESVADLAEMNRLFQAWLETAYHQAVHSETGEAPAARWEKATPEERAVPEPALLREAFLWSERRKADKTALVRLHGNVYQVDAWLAGRMRRAAVLPVRPGPDRGPPRREARRDRRPVRHRPAPPPQDPHPGRAGPHRARPDRDRLPRPPSATATTRPCASRSPTGSSSPARRSRGTGGTGGPGREGRRQAVTDSPQPDPGPGPHRGRGGPLPEPRHPRRPGPRPARRRLRAHRRAGARRGRPAAAAGPGRPVARRRPRRRAARLRRRHRPRRRGQRRLAVHLRRPQHRRRPGPRPRPAQQQLAAVHGEPSARKKENS